MLKIPELRLAERIPVYAALLALGASAVVGCTPDRDAPAPAPQPTTDTAEETYTPPPLSKKEQVAYDKAVAHCTTDLNVQQDPSPHGLLEMCLNGEYIPEPPAFTRATQSLAIEFCDALSFGGQTPANLALQYEDRFDALKQKYAMRQARATVSIETVADDYCPKEAGVFHSAG